MALEDGISDRLAPKKDIPKEGSKESSKVIVLPHGAAMELRQYSVDRALQAVDNLDYLNVGSSEEYGDFVVTVASKIENYVREGLKEENK